MRRRPFEVLIFFLMCCLQLSDLHAEGTDTADQIRIGGGHASSSLPPFSKIAAAQVPLVVLQAFASTGIPSAAAGGGIPSGLAARQQLVEQPLLSIVWQQLRGKKRSTLDVGLKASKPITPGTLLRSIALQHEVQALTKLHLVLQVREGVSSPAERICGRASLSKP